VNAQKACSEIRKISLDLTSFYSMENRDVLIKFGNKVRQFRKEKNLSQEELSFKAGLHRTYIGMIERAEKNITLINIEKIAKALDIDISIFFYV
jgi:DNA-binding XRE family transcriptional regulator